VLTAAASEGIAAVYFCIGTDSNKYKRVLANPKASVHYGTDCHSVTLVGEIEILADEATKKKFWYDGLAEHFPQGASDPNYVVLKFTTKRWKAFVDWQDFKGTM